jgi:hypothetical protein
MPANANAALGVQASLTLSIASAVLKESHAPICVSMLKDAVGNDLLE